MELVEYTEKSLLLKGKETKEYKKEIKELGGKWNSSLKGWIFSKKKGEEISLFLTSVKKPKGESVPQDEALLEHIKVLVKTMNTQEKKRFLKEFIEACFEEPSAIEVIKRVESEEKSDSGTSLDSD